MSPDSAPAMQKGRASHHRRTVWWDRTPATVVPRGHRGGGRGCGFGEMATAEEPDGPITRPNGPSLDGRTIQVEKAKAPGAGGGGDRRGGGGGGRGGFGGGGGGGRGGSPRGRGRREAHPQPPPPSPSWSRPPPPRAGGLAP